MCCPVKLKQLDAEMRQIVNKRLFMKQTKTITESGKTSVTKEKKTQARTIINY